VAPLTDPQRDALLKRLSFLQAELEDLTAFQPLTWEEYQRDRHKRREVERLAENYDEVNQRLIAFGGTSSEGGYQKRLLALPLKGSADLYCGLRVAVTESILNPLAGARVTVKNATGAEMASAETDEEGAWEATLPEGPYEVEVSKPGFKIHRAPVSIIKGKMARLSIPLGSEGNVPPLLKPSKRH